MGNVSENDVILGISAVERGLAELGYKFEAGVGVAAAMRALAEV